MPRDVSAGLIIGAALSKKSGRITNDDLSAVEDSIRKYAPEYYVDFTRNSIYSEIEANCDYFALEDDEIVLNESYMNNIGRIRRYFYEVLDADVRTAIDRALA